MTPPQAGKMTRGFGDDKSLGEAMTESASLVRGFVSPSSGCFYEVRWVSLGNRMVFALR